MAEKVEQFTVEAKRVVSIKEVYEFLKLIRQSEYSIVEHLHQQPTKISILSLLLNLDSHREALLKVLN